jgi:nucleoside-diphosphate-sugar epimerase
VTRVLITGGRGLLGRAVVREVARRGFEVVSFQRTTAGHDPAITEILGDITDFGALERAMASCGGVVHLAAKVSMAGDWKDFERINVRGTESVLRAATGAGVRRFVQVSSPSVAHAGHPLVGVGAEPANPGTARGNYARSKAMAELAALASDSEAMRTVAVRPHLVWGPGDTQLVGRIIERARRGRLALVDDGAALIDTTYVDNAATAIAQALDRVDEPTVHGRAFVVTNGEPRTVAEILARIAAAAGVQATRRHVPFALAHAAGSVVERAWAVTDRTDEPALTTFMAEQLATAHWFDQRQTRQALDWVPTVSLDEGFERLRQDLARSS